MIGILPVPDSDKALNVFEAGLLLPVPGQTPDTIVFERRDGSNILSLRAKRLEVKRHDQTLAKTENTEMSVFVTDARVAIACTKYDKGGGWVGSGDLAIAAVALNVGSKIRAAHQRHGRMLVGQVRYPYLESVKCIPRDGLFLPEQLFVTAKADAVTTVELQLILPTGVDSNRVACEIVRRAARFRLASETVSDGTQRELLEEFADLEPKPIAKRNFRRWILPTPAVISTDAARIDVVQVAGCEAADGSARRDEQPSNMLGPGESSGQEERAGRLIEGDAAAALRLSARDGGADTTFTPTGSPGATDSAPDELGARPPGERDPTLGQTEGDRWIEVFPRGALLNLDKIGMKVTDKIASTDPWPFTGWGGPSLKDGETALGRWFVPIPSGGKAPALEAMYDQSTGWRETAVAPALAPMASGAFCVLLTQTVLRITLQRGELAGWGQVDAQKGHPRLIFVCEWPLAKVDEVFARPRATEVGFQCYAPRARFVAAEVTNATGTWGKGLRNRAAEFAGAVGLAAARAQENHADPARRGRARAVIARGEGFKLSGETIRLGDMEDR